MFSLLIVIFATLIKISGCQQVDPCLPAQSCVLDDSSTVKCSSYGKCFYDVMQYYESGKTKSFQNCICEEGYTDLDSSQYVKCCYKRKSQLIAFLLEFVLGFGVGHFYIGNNQIGFLKLFGCLTFCCSCCTIAFCFCYKEENPKRNISLEVQTLSVNVNLGNDNKISRTIQPLKIKIFNIIMLFSIYALLIWHCVDVVLFGLNLFNDGNGIALQHW